MTEEEFKKAVPIVGNMNGLRAQIAIIEECVDYSNNGVITISFSCNKQVRTSLDSKLYNFILEHLKSRLQTEQEKLATL
jgi:hypothetical protein